MRMTRRFLFNPFIAAVLTLIYLELAWYDALPYLEIWLVVSTFLLLGINALTAKYSFEKWIDYFASILTYFVLFLLGEALIIMSREPNPEKAEDMGMWILIPFLIIINFASVIVGNLVGMWIKKFSVRSRK